MGAIKSELLPDVVLKINLFASAINYLTENGYDYIGIDHFAKPTDDLAIAKNNNTLCRHFMWYTAGKAPHLIGLGPSSLSAFNGHYVQNVYSIEDYQKSIAQKQFPVLRGYSMNKDNYIRWNVIHDFLCYFRLDFGAINKKWNIDFSDYFKTELLQLSPFIEDNILDDNDFSIELSEVGRQFARHVCTVFDKHSPLILDEIKNNYKPAIQKSAIIKE